MSLPFLKNHNKMPQTQQTKKPPKEKETQSLSLLSCFSIVTLLTCVVFKMLVPYCLITSHFRPKRIWYHTPPAVGREGLVSFLAEKLLRMICLIIVNKTKKYCVYWKSVFETHVVNVLLSTFFNIFWPSWEENHPLL